MKEAPTSLGEFRKFLASIPLDKYREETKNVKWVEQDLPKEIVPLNSLFKYYWEERNFLDFESWFEDFWKDINSKPKSRKALEEFKKYYFNRSIEENDWFKKGFKARMYRTWVSVLTQLDFCFVFEYVADKKNQNLSLICNAELDARGIDAQVNDISFQVVKISERKEARAGVTRRKIVPVFNFVINRESYVERIIDKLNNFPLLKNEIEKIYIELRGGNAQ